MCSHTEFHILTHLFFVLKVDFRSTAAATFFFFLNLLYFIDHFKNVILIHVTQFQMKLLFTYQLHEFLERASKCHKYTYIILVFRLFETGKSNCLLAKS